MGQSFRQKEIAPVAQGVAGPVGIFAVVKNIFQLGEGGVIVFQLLNFLALISLVLALANVLPIPALDGGRLPFIFWELFTGKRVPLKAEKIAHQIGFLLLISLLLLITYKDIVQFFLR